MSPSTWRSSCPAWPAAMCTWAGRMWAGADGRYDVVLECPADEPADSVVPAALLRDWPSPRSCTTCWRGGCRRWRPASTRSAGWWKARASASARPRSPRAARRRGIPVRRVGSRSMLRLGYGRHRRLVCAALTEPDLGRRGGHRRRQGAGQAAAGRGRHSRCPAERSRLQPAGGGRAARAARRTSSDQAERRHATAPVSPSACTTPAAAEAAYAKASAAHRGGDRRGVHPRPGLPGTRHRRPGGGRRRAAARPRSPAMARSTIRQLIDQANADPAARRRPLPRADQDHAGRRGASATWTRCGLRRPVACRPGRPVTLRTQRQPVDRRHQPGRDRPAARRGRRDVPPGRRRLRPGHLRHRPPAGRHHGAAARTRPGTARQPRRRGDRAQRVPRAADAPVTVRGHAPGRGRRDHRPAVPAGRRRPGSRSSPSPARTARPARSA